MEYQFSIENLGNIRSAIVDIKPLTVIAGANSSGKSFVTKSLYSILDSLNGDHLSANLVSKYNHLVSLLDHGLKVHLPKTNESIELFYSLREDLVGLIEELLEAYSNCASLVEQKESLNTKSLVSEISEHKQKLLKIVETKKKVKSYQVAIEMLNDVIEIIEFILKAVEKPEDIYSYEIKQSLEENIRGNFQIKYLEDLVTIGEEAAKLNLSQLGNIEIKPLKDGESDLNFSLTPNGVSEIQRISEVIFIDSPAYLKVKKALTGQKFKGLPFFLRRRFFEEDERLRGYPAYLDKVLNIEDDFYGETSLKKVAKKLDEIIGGSLVVNDNGDIAFTQELEEGKVNSYPLSLTATGITNIGTISLLIRNNHIKKGSFVFIDEPEAHLHPEWQVKLVQILHELSRNDVHVVIATHSADILKAVELVTKESPDFRNSISINHLPFSEKFREKGIEEQIKFVLNDLSKPFTELLFKSKLL